VPRARKKELCSADGTRYSRRGAGVAIQTWRADGLEISLIYLPGNEVLQKGILQQKETQLNQQTPALLQNSVHSFLFVRKTGVRLPRVLLNVYCRGNSGFIPEVTEAGNNRQNPYILYLSDPYALHTDNHSFP